MAVKMVPTKRAVSAAFFGVPSPNTNRDMVREGFSRSAIAIESNVQFIKFQDRNTTLVLKIRLAANL